MKNITIEKILEEKAPIIDEAIEKYIPRKYDTDSLVFTLGSPRYEYHLEAINKAIVEPIWELLDRGGKRWRPTLFILIFEALGKDPEEFLDFAIIPEVIHNGLIIIDDIEDESESRRGKRCTCKLYGLDIATNAGNEMFYLPLLALMKSKERLPQDKVNKIYDLYVQEMINVGFGQAMDIAWHRGLANADGITEKQYLQMCAYKTGAIARMAAKMAAVLADVSDEVVEKFGRFAESIGVAFQIQDDVLDLVSEEFAEMKGGIGRDITEGKRSLVVIHTLGKAEPRNRRRLIEILNMHTTDQKIRDEAIGIIGKHGSIEYAENLARNMVRDSWRDVDAILPPSEGKEKLKAFADYMIKRRI
ncbi:MAG: polyprenyl synthetase family protein [Candidatus Bathyarchaeota archaeon]|nr:MAG: polyprenyl synthetase family protein [Candidatus Bathyarchaeota archaeon]